MKPTRSSAERKFYTDTLVLCVSLVLSEPRITSRQLKCCGQLISRAKAALRARGQRKLRG